MSNRYLIQALRAYRQVSVGQFDQETRHVVQETQDAADALEEADRRIAELEKGVMVKLKAGATPGVGLVSDLSWGRIANLVENWDASGMGVTAVVATPAGLQITWERG